MERDFSVAVDRRRWRLVTIYGDRSRTVLPCQVVAETIGETEHWIVLIEIGGGHKKSE